MGLIGDDDDDEVKQTKTDDFFVDIGDTLVQDYDSQFSSPSLSGEKLVGRGANEFHVTESTLLLDDTVPVEDSFETQLLNDCGETQVLDDFTCIENFSNTQVIDDSYSDGEGAYRTDVLDDSDKSFDNVSQKGFGSHLVDRDMHPKKGKGYIHANVIDNFPDKLHKAASVWACDLSPNAKDMKEPKDSESFKQHAAGNNAIRNTLDEAGGRINQNHTFVNSTDNMKGLRISKNGKIGCSVARKLFTEENTLAGNEESMHVDETNSGVNFHQSGLNYVCSQEPGEFTQNNALEFVDKLIQVNVMELNEEDDHDWSAKVKLYSAPPCTNRILRSNGPQSIAKRASIKSNFEETKIFEFNGNEEDEGGGDLLCRRKEELFGRRNMGVKCVMHSKPQTDTNRSGNVDEIDSKVILHGKKVLSAEKLSIQEEFDASTSIAQRIKHRRMLNSQSAKKAPENSAEGKDGYPLEEVVSFKRKRESTKAKPLNRSSSACSKTFGKHERKVQSNRSPDVTNASRIDVSNHPKSKTGQDLIGKEKNNQSRMTLRSSKNNQHSGVQKISPPKKKVILEASAGPGLECNPTNSPYSTSNCVTPVSQASPICMGKEYLKQSCRGNLLRSPLHEELYSSSAASLDTTDLKKTRRRRDMSSVHVLFSRHMDSDTIKHQKKILSRLGMSTASSISDATHFVTDQFVRTRNMLEAIARGKPVVTSLWLEICGQASCFVDEKNYILRDSKKEKQFGFSMPVSLARARHHQLLEGLRIFITPNTKPGKEIISSLVKALHGQVVERLGRCTDVLVLSCEEDHALCVPFQRRGVAVYSSELLLDGIVTQRLDYERYRLFVDCNKRSGR